MITKWYKATIASIMCAVGTTSDSISSFAAKSILGTTYYIINTASNNISDLALFCSSTLQTNTSSAGFRVGTGTTPPTENDYSLEAQITSGITGVVTRVYEAKSDYSGWVIKATLLITNAGAEPITITEIGAFDYIRANTAQNATGQGNQRLFMVDRSLLAVPITIPAGESGAIEYSVEVSV